MYQDINTNQVNNGDDEQEIHMDAMAFGAGCCCLQVTFQASDIKQARYLYDQLAVLSPIMMALTASTPFFKGQISDFDCRWMVIAQSVDDRNDEELGVRSISGSKENENEKRIYKSRYGTIDSFLGSGNCLQVKLVCMCVQYTYTFQKLYKNSI